MFASLSRVPSRQEIETKSCPVSRRCKVCKQEEKIDFFLIKCDRDKCKSFFHIKCLVDLRALFSVSVQKIKQGGLHDSSSSRLNYSVFCNDHRLFSSLISQPMSQPQKLESSKPESDEKLNLTTKPATEKKFEEDKEMEQENLDPAGILRELRAKLFLHEFPVISRFLNNRMTQKKCVEGCNSTSPLLNCASDLFCENGGKYHSECQKSHSSRITSKSKWFIKGTEDSRFCPKCISSNLNLDAEQKKFNQIFTNFSPFELELALSLLEQK